MAISDRELKAILQAEKAQALSSLTSSDLSRQRDTAMRYYLGDMRAALPAAPGGSQAVSTDVSDTVEGMMPNLMDIFCGSDDVVRFDPTGPEDVQAAMQETDYVNYVFGQQNNGFIALYSMIKDALVSKTGTVKVWWEESETEDRDTYYNQPGEVVELFAQDQGVKIVEQSPSKDYPDTFDITISKKRDTSRCCIEPVPPEEFGTSKRTKLDFQSTTYCFHETVKTQAELISLGYDRKLIDGLPSYAMADGASTNTEHLSRDTVKENTQASAEDTVANKAARPIRYTEHYIIMDYTGDRAAKYMVVTAGEDSVVLKKKGDPSAQEIDWWPFAHITPVPQPHRFIGRSVADLVMDIQRIKTELIRNLLDNAYLHNKPQTEVPEGACTPETIDDLLNLRAGGIVRTKQPGMIREIEHADISSSIYPALQYFDATREWRTGVTRQGQGLDADALSNQTATAAMQLYNAAQARLKLIARIFAETGIADLFWLIHATCRKYSTKSQVVRLRNQWVEVDPRDWKERQDMTVEVGLGRGGKAEEMANIMQLVGLQKEALEGGYTDLVTPNQLFNSAADFCKVIGKKDVDRFFTDPGEDAEHPEPAPDPALQKAQMDAQVKQQELQMKQQELQMKSQLDLQNMQHKAQIEQIQAQADIATQDKKTEAEMALAQQKFALERELKIIDAQLKHQQHGMEMQKAHETHQLDIEKAELGVQTQAQKANIDNSMKVEDHARKQKEAAAKTKTEDAKGPISSGLKKMMDAQTKQAEQIAKLQEAVEADREIEIKRDAKGKAAGAVSRRKKAQ